MEEAFAVVGKLLAVIFGSGATAYFLFRFLGEKWIETKFSERLEDYRHKQAKEMEDLRLRINVAFDRVSKLNQQEFEVLPEAWRRLTEAFYDAYALVSPFQSTPNLDRMTPEEIEEFFGSSPLAESEKLAIRSSSKKTKEYRDKVFWHSLNAARKSARESGKYLLTQGVFLRADLVEQMKELDDIIWQSLVERRVRQEVDGGLGEEGKATAKLLNEGEAMLRRIGVDIGIRLREEAALLPPGVMDTEGRLPAPRKK